MPDQVMAGETMALALHWQPVAAFDGDYIVFVHVEVEGQELWGQHDGAPVCGTKPTTNWESGKTVIDGHFVPIDPATPPGEYPVMVGLYDLRTGERLPVSGSNANEWGNAIHLGTVEVLPPAGAQESVP
jgi:hypothetical protein